MIIDADATSSSTVLSNISVGLYAGITTDTDVANSVSVGRESDVTAHSLPVTNPSLNPIREAWDVRLVLNRSPTAAYSIKRASRPSSSRHNKRLTASVSIAEAAPIDLAAWGECLKNGYWPNG